MSMRMDEFRAGAHWAYREGRALAVPAIKVELRMWVPAKPPSRKSPQVKVRYLEGDLAGMEEFVPPGRMVCPWKEWPRQLRFEQSEVALRDGVSGPDHDIAMAKAANVVFQATGEDVFVDDLRGYTRGQSVEVLERVAKRAGWPPERIPWIQKPNFVRDGRAYIANRFLIELARDFAEQNPDPVTLLIDNEEAELRERGFSGSRWCHKYLLELGPAHSIARDWAGGAARSHLNQELRDLRAIVFEALNALRKVGAAKEADALEKKLNRHTAKS